MPLSSNTQSVIRGLLSEVGATQEQTTGYLQPYTDKEGVGITSVDELNEEQGADLIKRLNVFKGMIQASGQNKQNIIPHDNAPEGGVKKTGAHQDQLAPPAPAAQETTPPAPTPPAPAQAKPQFQQLLLNYIKASNELIQFLAT